MDYPKLQKNEYRLLFHFTMCLDNGFETLSHNTLAVYNT